MLSKRRVCSEARRRAANAGPLPLPEAPKAACGSVRIFAAGVLWGCIGLFIRLLSAAGASAALTSFLRMAFAFLILLVYTLLRFGVSAFRVSGRTLLLSAALGVVCHGIYNVFYTLAVTLAGVTVSAVLLNVAPVFTALLSAAFFREKLTRQKWAALALNVSGCILAATGGGISTATLPVAGLLCGTAAGFCYSLTAIIGRFANEKADPCVVSTYSCLFASLFLAPFLRPRSDALPLNGRILLLGFFYALVPTVIAYLLYYRGLRTVSESSRVPVIASAETPVSAVIGVAVFNELLNAANVLGIVLVMLSIVLMNRTKPGQPA